MQNHVYIPKRGRHRSVFVLNNNLELIESFTNIKAAANKYRMIDTTLAKFYLNKGRSYKNKFYFFSKETLSDNDIYNILSFTEYMEDPFLYIDNKNFRLNINEIKSIQLYDIKPIVNKGDKKDVDGDSPL
jgi:hypothetical protein